MGEILDKNHVAQKNGGTIFLKNERDSADALKECPILWPFSGGPTLTARRPGAFLQRRPKSLLGRREFNEIQSRSVLVKISWFDGGKLVS